MRQLPSGLINPGMKEMAILSALLGICVGALFYPEMIVWGLFATKVVLMLLLFISALNSSIPKQKNRYLCFLIAWTAVFIGFVLGIEIRYLIWKAFS